MGERDLEFDDDGKIRIRRAGEPAGEGEEDEIVIEVPDLGPAEEEKHEDEIFADRRAERERALAERRERALALYEEGEELFARGELEAAGEKFLDSGELYGTDWRPWFGVVRVQTKDLTDFSEISDCEQAYDKAMRRMSREDLSALSARYGPALTARADALAAEHARRTAEDEREREQARPAVLREVRLSSTVFGLMCAFFGVFLIASVTLWSLINAVQGVEILVPAIVCSAVGIVFFVLAAVFCKRLVLARAARARNARAGTTDAGEQARILAETEEIIRAILEDLSK